MKMGMMSSSSDNYFINLIRGFQGNGKCGPSGARPKKDTDGAKFYDPQGRRPRMEDPVSLHEALTTQSGESDVGQTFLPPMLERF